MFTIPKFHMFGGCGMCCTGNNSFVFVSDFNLNKTPGFASVTTKGVCIHRSSKKSMMSIFLAGNEGALTYVQRAQRSILIVVYVFSTSTTAGDSVLSFDCASTIVAGDITIEFYHKSLSHVCRYIVV
jgi:hypothetical protein